MSSPTRYRPEEHVPVTKDAHARSMEIGLLSRPSGRFKEMKNGLPWGSIEAGLARMDAQKDLPQNAPIQIQLHFRTLSDLYHQLNVIDEDIIEGRRQMAHTDPVDGEKADRNQSRNTITSQIYKIELLISMMEKELQLQSQNNKIDIERIAALKDVARYKFFARMGDYVAILNQELKTSEKFARYEFRKFNYVSDMIKALDKEILLIDAAMGGPKPDTPILESLKAACVYYGNTFENVDQMIDLLRVYASRNIEFHLGAKKHYDDGDFAALYKAMLDDKKEMPAWRLDEGQEKKFLSCIQSVHDRFYIHTNPLTPGVFLLTARGQKLHKKAVEKGIEDSHQQALSAKDLRNLEKDRKGRETSQIAADERDKRLNIQTKYTAALVIISELKNESTSIANSVRLSRLDNYIRDLRLDHTDLLLDLAAKESDCKKKDSDLDREKEKTAARSQRILELNADIENLRQGRYQDDSELNLADSNLFSEDS